jgi:hypothetical protein
MDNQEKDVLSPSTKPVVAPVASDPYEGIGEEIKQPSVQPKAQDPYEGIGEEVAKEGSEEAYSAKVEEESRKSTEELQDFSFADRYMPEIPRDVSEGHPNIGAEYKAPRWRDYGDRAITSHELKAEEDAMRLISPGGTEEELRARAAAEGTVSPWMVNPPLEAATRLLEETHPDTVVARVSRGVMDAETKLVEQASLSAMTSPMGKAFTAIVNLIAPETEAAKKMQSIQNAHRAGLLEEGRIPVVSDVMDIAMFGPPSMWTTKLGAFMLPILTAGGQAADVAADVEGAFNPMELFMSTLMAGLMKAGGFIPASAREKLLTSGGGAMERIAKELVPKGVMAAEVTGMGAIIQGSMALASGDAEGFKKAWQESPKNFSRALATYSVMGALNIVKAGSAGKTQTYLEQHGASKSQAADWANLLHYNKASTPYIKEQLSQMLESQKLTPERVAQIANTLQGDMKNPAYAEVIRFFHQGEKLPPPALPAEPGKPVTQPTLKAVKVAQPVVEKSRYIAGEMEDKGILRERLKSIPEVTGLSRRQRTLLSEAIDKYDGSIESLNPKTLDNIIRAVKFSQPLRSAETIQGMDDTQLNRYIAGTLYQRQKVGRGGYLADMKKLGIKGEGLTKISHEDKIKLALHGTEQYPGRLKSQVPTTQQSLEKYLTSIKGETVSEAALKLADGTIITGKTHPDAMMKAVKKGLNVEGAERGATTSKRGFIDATEAGVISGLKKPELWQSSDIGQKVSAEQVKKNAQRYAGVLIRQTGIAQLEQAKDAKLRDALLSAVKDAKGVDVALRGPGITDAERVAVYSYLSDGEWIQKHDPNGTYRKTFINNLDYPMPRDPESMRSTLLRYQQEMRGQVLAGEHITNPNTQGVVQGFYKGMRNFAARYLAMDKIARDTGNYNTLTLDKERLRVTKESDYQARQLFEKSFKDVNVDRNIIAYINDKPRLGKAMKVAMAFSPTTQDKRLRQARTDAIEIIKKDARGGELFRLAESFHKLLNSESAVDVRKIKVIEFGDVWNEVKYDYKNLTSIPEGQRTKAQKKQLTAINKSLAFKLPWRHNKATGKGEQVPVDEMARALDVHRAGDKAAETAYLSKPEQDWGTREHYYMSTKSFDIDTLMAPKHVSEAPFPEKSLIETGVKPTSSILRRTGVAEFKEGNPIFKEGNPISAIERHVTSLRVQANALELSRAVAKDTDIAANMGYIEKWTAERLNSAVKQDLGQMERAPDPLAKAMYGVTRAWWTAFGLTLPKMAWYTFRNIAYQGAPWGAIQGQYQAADIARAGALSAREWNNPKSWAHKHMQEDFNDVIAVGKKVYYEGMLQMAHSERTRIPNKILSKSFEIVGALFGASDNWNRRYTTFTGDVITEGYIDKFVSGQINQAQLETGLRLNALPEGHRHYLVNLFSQAKFAQRDKAGNPVLKKENFYNFMKQVSETKTLLANYPYQTSERSALEQNPDARWYYGIPVYPRGTLEVLNETVGRPLAGVWHNYKESGYKMSHFDYNTAKNAVGNLTGQLLGRAISSLILSKVVGEKVGLGISKFEGKTATQPAYGLAESIMSYGFLGPGSSGILKISNIASKLASAIYAKDWKDAQKQANSMGDSLFVFLPVFPLMVPILEAAGNRKEMRNVDAILSLAKGRITGGKYKPRETHAAILHALFDTEPMNREDSLYETYQRMRKWISD